MFSKIFRTKSFFYAKAKSAELLLGRKNNSNFKNYTVPAILAIASVIAIGSDNKNSQCAHNKDLSTSEKLDKIVQMLENHDLGKNSRKGVIDVIVGSQWGDEGKGKLVDILSSNYDICARVAGGSNAGHTIIANGKKYKFHLIPSGILNPSVHCVIGNGVVVNIRELLTEMNSLEEAGINFQNRLHISDRAHIVFDFHKSIDGLNEKRLAGKKIGTTLKGIGPSYGSKTMRNGLRMGDLEDFEYFESRLINLASQLQSSHPDLEIDIEAELLFYKSIRSRILPLIIDTIQYSNDALDKGKNILVEGANATMLDLDFGTYPYVTSSNPSIGSTFTGLGVSPHSLRNVTGIVKAYCTRVGEGPFPTELFGPEGERLREAGGEYGTTTGRPRRCGWIDIPQLKYALKINGVSEINLTKLDVLSNMDEIKIGVSYSFKESKLDHMPASLKKLSSVSVEYETLPGWKQDISKCKTYDSLPKNCRAYIERLECLLGIKIKWVGVGPDREDLIEK